MTQTPLNAPLSVPDPRPLDEALTGLEQVIEAAMADPVHWRAFEQLLPNVDLFLAPNGATLAAMTPGESGMRVLRSDQAMDVMGVGLDDGRVAAAAFTDPRRLQALWGDDTVFIAMNGHHVLNLYREGPMILNPGSPRVMLFQKADIATLLMVADALAQQAGTAGGRPSGTMKLSVPAPVPQALVDALRQAFGPVGGTGITAAWLARADWAGTSGSGTGQAGWFLDTRTTRPMDEIKAMVGRAVQSIGFGGETLDVGVEAPGAADGFGLRLI